MKNLINDLYRELYNKIIIPGQENLKCKYQEILKVENKEFLDRIEFSIMKDLDSKRKIVRIQRLLINPVNFFWTKGG